jgi:putative ABC transport system permease protein
MPILHYALFLRTVRKEREIYLLKILTLSIGFACTLVIILFCWNEFRFDRFHQDPNSVFRVIIKNEEFNFEGNRYSDRISSPFFKSLSSQEKWISLARCKVLEMQTLKTQRQLIPDQTLHATDGSIADIFSFRIVQGSIDAYRTTPHAALISSSASKRYFGTSESSGSPTIIVAGKDSIPMKVVAVFDDFPSNSHEKFEVFVKFDSTDVEKLSMDPSDFGVYGRCSNLISIQPLEEKINNLKNADTSKTKDARSQRLILQPLPEIHFGRRVIGESARHGDLYSVLILVCIASLIFLLALANFVNLTTLTLPNRAKELAIKKVAGAGRLSLLLGFGVESFIVVLISMGLSFIILVCVKGVIHSGIPLNIDLLLAEKQVMMLSILGLMLITCVGPLLVTIKFIKSSPTKLLSTETITFPRFKKIITVFQLGICLSLLVSAMVVKNQITYSLVKEPGRNKDQVVYLPYPHGLTTEGLHRLENMWRKDGVNPNIEGVTAVSHLPNQIIRKKLGRNVYSLMCDRNFSYFFRYPIIRGRWFGGSDSLGIVLNQLAAKDRPVGEKNVLGVISNLAGIYNQSEMPLEISLGNGRDFNFLCIRIIEVDVRKTVAYLADYFKLPGGTKDVKFLDGKFADWLVYEDRLGSLCGMLAIISGIMALFAIYGLSLSLGNDRIKQVAIHKMLGASLPDIVRILMGSFAMPMLIAVLAFGLATYIFLKEWLRNFIYQTHFGIQELIIALTFCIIIITATCARQAAKLTGRNLVEYLKS